MKTISELDSVDKPREKLIKKGVGSLKDYELLGSGTLVSNEYINEFNGSISW